MEKCPYCANEHEAQCSRVKAFTYFVDGSLKKVEFFSPKAFGINFDLPSATITTPVKRKE